MVTDVRFFGLAQVRSRQCLAEKRAGILQFHVPVAVFEMADVAQGKDRFAAVALAAHHRGDSARGRHRGLGGIANAVALDAGHDRLPVQRWAAPVALIGGQGRGGLPLHAARLFGIVDAPVEGQEGATRLSQGNALRHRW